MRCLLVLIGLLLFPGVALAAEDGTLKQLVGNSGCLADETSTPAGCTDVRAIENSGDIVTTPDGAHAYVTSTSKDAIAVFDRNGSTGTLTQKSGVLGCVTTLPAVATSDSCNLFAPGDASALDGPTALAVSPDGKSLYAVTQQGRLAAFDVAADGTLTFNMSSNLSGTGSALSTVAVSPDGASVYPAGPGNSGIIAHYGRTTTPGSTLGDIQFVNCFSVTTCGGGVPQNLGTVSEVVVTPDNSGLLIANANTNAILSWNRSTSPGTVGNMTPSSTPSRCVSHTTLSGTCQARPGLITPQSLALTNEGTRVHVGSQQALVTIARNATDNSLAPDTTGNCFAYPTSSFSGCPPLPGSAFNSTFFPARDLIATPNGEDLYLGTEAANAAIFGFDRNGGTVTPQPRPTGCASVGAVDGCSTFRQGNRIQEMWPSPDSRHVYAVGNNRLFAFEVDRAPVCSDVTAETVQNQSTVVQLSCSDPDGDPITYQVVTQPANGNVGGVQGSQVTYGPFVGTTGVDSFTYRAVAAGTASDPASATVTVAPPNRAPSADADSFKAKEGKKLKVKAPGVLDNDSDPDGDTLSAALAKGAKHGKVKLKESGAFTYKPDNGYSGKDKFKYELSDGRGGTDTAKVKLKVKSE